MLTPPPSAASAQPSDPSQDPAPAASPTYTARLLGLVRKLIDFGTEIAAAVQHRPTAKDRAPLALRFGTQNIALMLASIARGLRLAAILEERLGGPPARRNPAQATARALSRPRARTTPRAPRPAPPAQENVRAGLPSTRKIAAWARRYPLETVLIHVRSYLGLTPDHPLWQEVNDILVEHHADLMRKQDIRNQAQAVATGNPSQEAKGHPNGHASPRDPDARTRNQYRASLVRSTTCLSPDTPLVPFPLSRQPAQHPVSGATSGAGPPQKAA